MTDTHLPPPESLPEPLPQEPEEPSVPPVAEERTSPPSLTNDESTLESAGTPGAVPASPTPGLAELETLRAEVKRLSEELLATFERKIAYDQHKDAVIDRLHAEVMEHRQDQIGKIIKPLLLGIIQIHDDIYRQKDAYLRRAPETLTPALFFEAFEGIADDIRILLEQHDITSYREDGQRFNAGRQTASKTVPTADETLVGQIVAAHLPGFEREREILKKERVVVYVKETAPTPVAASKNPS